MCIYLVIAIPIVHICQHPYIYTYYCAYIYIHTTILMVCVQCMYVAGLKLFLKCWPWAFHLAKQFCDNSEKPCLGGMHWSRTIPLSSSSPLQIPFPQL